MTNFQVNIMDLRDGSCKTLSVPSIGDLHFVYAHIQRKNYLEFDRSKIKFFLLKHDDGKWLNKDSDEARALIYDKEVRPPLRAMLERPPLARWITLEDSRCLGPDFVFDEKDIHIMYLLPFKSPLKRWGEKLKRLPCGSF